MEMSCCPLASCVQHVGTMVPHSHLWGTVQWSGMQQRDYSCVESSDITMTARDVVAAVIVP